MMPDPKGDNPMTGHEAPYAHLTVGARVIFRDYTDLPGTVTPSCRAEPRVPGRVGGAGLPTGSPGGVALQPGVGAAARRGWSAMKPRITGTRDECAAAIEAIGAVLTVREVSGFYPNRGASELGRVYLDADAPTDVAPVRADAERTDRGDRTAIRSARDDRGRGGAR